MGWTCSSNENVNYAEMTKSRANGSAQLSGRPFLALTVGQE
jgi:hypothetical protein